jgi:hypothetical protein
MSRVVRIKPDTWARIEKLVQERGTTERTADDKVRLVLDLAAMEGEV